MTTNCTVKPLRGQSSGRDSRKSRAAEAVSLREKNIPQLNLVQFTLFETPSFGWWGIAGAESTLTALVCGHPSFASARKQLARTFPELSLVEGDWNALLHQRLMEYAVGESVCFDDIPLQLPSRTAFQSRVLEQVRAIPYGTTMTYGEVAAAVGHPRAARAVGTVMSSNRIPILIPCHRVIGSQGQLCGYTNPQGISLKERMLAMEALSAR